MGALSALVVLSLLQQPPRDVPPPAAAVGAGTIKGRVVAADTGTPIRGVIVTVAGPPGVAQTLYTDGQGKYEARTLPPGSYAVSARPNVWQAQFLPSWQPPGSPQRRVPLAVGQTLEWHDIGLPRAGAVVGRLVDRYGDPVSGVSVQARRVGVSTSSWASQSSDEHGRFRVFRLEPGEYDVVARPAGMSGRLPGENVGFIETYYPSAPTARESGRVTVRAGQDTAIGDLQLISARLLRVGGTVVTAGGGRAGPSTSIAISTESSGMSRSVDAEGRFSFEAQPPGAYRVYARGLSENREALLEHGSVSLTLTDSDVDDLIVTMKPTVSISGQVVFEGLPAGAKPAGSLSIRADAKQRDRVAQEVPLSPAPVGGDLTFTLRNLATELLLRPNGGLIGTWSLKSVLLGSEDITDVPREFRPEDSGRIQILMTTRWAEISGTITGDKGERIDGRTALLFSDDRSVWFAESSRMRAAYARDGGFLMRGLRPGRYYLAVLPPDVHWDFQRIDTGFLEKLALDATPVVLGEDDRRQVDLRVPSSGNPRIPNP